MDYEAIISEKFPNCNVEVITPNLFGIEEVVEYITDDIVVYGPHSVMVYRHLIRFLVNVGERGKIYYLDGFSDDDLPFSSRPANPTAWRMIGHDFTIPITPAIAMPPIPIRRA